VPETGSGIGDDYPLTPTTTTPIITLVRTKQTEGDKMTKFERLSQERKCFQIAYDELNTAIISGREANVDSGMRQLNRLSNEILVIEREMGDYADRA
jgi:hypothetical protein